MMENTNKIALAMLSLILVACAKPEEVAKNLGFGSVEEMREMNSKGFKTMDQYWASLIPGSGCKNIEELKNAHLEVGGDCNKLNENNRKKKEEEERIRLEAAKAAAQAAKFQTLYTYKWYPNNSCKDEKESVCVDKADYEYLCRHASGTTAIGASTLSWRDEAANHLLINGGLERTEFFWDDQKEYGCRIRMTVDGIYKGSQIRKTIEGVALEFIVNEARDILIFVAYSGDH